MRFACLGYYDEKAWQAVPAAEQEQLIQQCLAYDEVLKKAGHFVDGLALQGAQTATTVRWGNGKASVTDGPFAETKEILGGILVLEARDRAHALEIMSKHPGARFGPFEIRPLDEEMTARSKAPVRPERSEAKTPVRPERSEAKTPVRPERSEAKSKGAR